MQLGLAGEMLRRYSQEWIEKIADLSGFVSEQRMHAQAEGFPNLVIPCEEVYAVNNPEAARRLGIDHRSENS